MHIHIGFGFVLNELAHVIVKFEIHRIGRHAEVLSLVDVDVLS